MSLPLGSLSLVVVFCGVAGCESGVTLVEGIATDAAADVAGPLLDGLNGDSGQEDRAGSAADSSAPDAPRFDSLPGEPPLDCGVIDPDGGAEAGAADNVCPTD